jgi:glycosyltransferase involved in cell wall biosynthesis
MLLNPNFTILLLLLVSLMRFDQPLVSVLVTNYNYGRYLREAINSVLNQTYSPVEIIVVDDGSKDDSREVIASYQDKIIPVFKENGGQASAINAGFAISQGDIICSLDADDVWLPTKVEEVVKAASNYPNAVIIYHKVQNTDQAGNLIGQPWPPYKVIRGNISSKVARTGSWWPWPPSTALSFRRAFLTKVMDIPEEGEFRFSAEPYLADLAPFFGEVIGIDRALSLFRIHGANNWSNRVDIEKRSLKNLEVRVQVLNIALKNYGINVEVSLADHWPYQLFRYKLGYEKNLIHLSRLALQNPWVSSLPSKLRTVFKLWFEVFEIGSSRL